ncbi:AraC family transcriptional regulator [Microlunatus sp. Gsoil 973]|uniref:helix-turn-helix transcriptional regulator n=1 Tax=Microlunatus sp. Gsoil 973 TaxID=2672569 RepID=UPI0012B4FCFD|nr:AraC family transcriptional regulator [Microlunatus sp. Gsoil 973]QGN33921.1 helix-turn-helix domain-containing protein [Microlunatus sp. Gsoil 973]
MSTSVVETGRSPAPGRSVFIDLDEPPEVVNQGRGVHGVSRREDRFRLPELWSLHLYGYHAELQVDGLSLRVAPGTVSLVPPAADIRYRYQGPSTHLYAHLRARGGYSRSEESGPLTRLEVLMSPGAELPTITDLMESAVAAAPVRPVRTRADVWQVLLRLADRPAIPRATPVARDHVVAAMSYIESRLPEPLTVPEVAEAVGISTNHLARLFGSEAGQTVVGYIRRRRIDRARRLLAASTMSISAIAASVGIPDLQSFNKACRTVTGRSPRQLRDGTIPDSPAS